MVEFLIHERSQELAAIIQCNSKIGAKRLSKWLSGPRPEFKDELEPGEEPWFALMDLWPGAKMAKIKGSQLFVHWWDESTPKGQGLLALDALDGLSVQAFFHKPIGAGEAEEEQYDGECDEMGFFVVKRDDGFQLIRQNDWLLPSGHELRSVKSTLEKDLIALTA